MYTIVQNSGCRKELYTLYTVQCSNIKYAVQNGVVKNCAVQNGTVKIGAVPNSAVNLVRTMHSEHTVLVVFVYFCLLSL